MDINKIFQSKIFKSSLIGLLALIILLFVFKAGTMVGIRKADFSCRWSDNYHRNFGGPKGGFAPGFGDRDFLDANGTFGKIIKIDGQTLVIKGQNDVEKIILADDNTAIKSQRDTVKISDLKIDEYIVVIGEPNDAGQILAKLIRIMPPPGAGPAGPPPMPRL
jgi:hypothetical protein